MTSDTPMHVLDVCVCMWLYVCHDDFSAILVNSDLVKTGDTVTVRLSVVLHYLCTCSYVNQLHLRYHLGGSVEVSSHGAHKIFGHHHCHTEL